jgi:hypothetical protein
MDRETYWHDEYEAASTEYRKRKEQFDRVDSERAIALAAMNNAERELNRLFALKFNTPGVTVSASARMTTTQSQEK